MLGNIPKIIARFACLLCLLASGDVVQGQTGYLQGYVFRSQGHDPLGDVTVRLDYLGSDAGMHRTTVTTDSGLFQFNDLPAGFYSVNTDSFAEGFAEDVVEIVPRTVTYVTLVLSGAVSWTEYSPTFSLRGVVSIQEDPDSGIRHYRLDVGGNSTVDYRLILGPPWYGAPVMERPANGEPVWIEGSLFGYSDPPMIIVRGIDNIFWRDTTDHGGAGGALQNNLECPIDLYRRIELNGYVTVRGTQPPLDDSTVYLFSTLDDSLQTFLDFGEVTYQPETGASRPTQDGLHSIIGGFYSCRQSPLPRAVVYELDGLFWREPGDTTGFGWADLAAPDTPPLGPHDFGTIRNYPNPFNNATAISFALPRPAYVSLRVYDLIGREVAVLRSGVVKAGTHSVVFDSGPLPSGIYFACLDARAFRLTTKMVLLK